MGLLDQVAGGTRNQTKAMLERVHPVYEQLIRSWVLGLDAYDESGGFVGGGYLWPFPREDTEQFAARRKQARYHNYVETLVDIYARSVTTGITRETSNPELAAWWEDVDTRGTPMTEYMLGALGQALAGGHAGMLVDMDTAPVMGPAVSDNPNRPYVATFTSQSIRDWRMDRQGLAAVKLHEDASPSTLGEDLADKQFLLWDRDVWMRFSANGESLGMGEHGLGLVPLVMVRPKPSRRHAFIGKPLVSSSLVQSLYNRASEEDLVLRDQAFSLFVVQLPSDATSDDVDEVNQLLRAGVGTTTAIVTKGTADFTTPDMQVPKTLRENQLQLVHEMYRMAHLRFQRDTLDAESGEALRLQRQDLDSTLGSIAEHLQSVEEEVARVYLAWQAPPGQAEAAFERANVQIQYPQEFALTNVEQELTSLALAMEQLRGSQTAAGAIRRRMVRVILPDLNEDTIEQVRQELEQAPQGLDSGAETLRQAATDRLRAAGVEIEAA